jgi:hypothetical protein
MTANLQPGLTVKQAAQLMNVSERSIYKVRELQRTGRDDLCDAIMRGEMSIHAALKIAKPEKYDRRPDTLKALRRAWNAATEDERAWLLAEIGR